MSVGGGCGCSRLALRRCLECDSFSVAYCPIHAQGQEETQVCNTCLQSRPLVSGTDVLSTPTPNHSTIQALQLRLAQLYEEQAERALHIQALEAKLREAKREE